VIGFMNPDPFPLMSPTVIWISSWSGYSFAASDIPPRDKGIKSSQTGYSGFLINHEFYKIYNFEIDKHKLVHMLKV